MQKTQRLAPTPTHERKLSSGSAPKALSGQEFEEALREALEALQLNNEEQAKPKISSGGKPAGNAAADVKPRLMKRKHMNDDDNGKESVRRH